MNFNRFFIALSLFLFLPFFLLGQYRDTTTSTNFASDSKAAIHKKKVHHKSFPSSKDRKIETLFEYNNDRLRYYFLDDFELGSDSVFIQSTEYGDTVYLDYVFEFFDKTGTARLTYFFFNGQVKSIDNFIGIGLDTLYQKMRSTSLGIAEGFDSTYIDTVYVYGSMRHGELVQYHENGQLRYKSKLNLNRHDGRVQAFHANGKTASIENFQDGYLVDSVLSYHENGELRSKIFYKNYLPHGEYKKWYSNRNLELEGVLVFSKFDGEVKNYYENGQLKALHRWKISEDSRPLEVIKKEEYYRNQGFIAEGGDVVGYDGTERDSALLIQGAYQIKYTNYRQGKSEYWKEDGTKLMDEVFLLGKSVLKKNHASESEIDDFFGTSKKENCRKKIVLRLEDDEGMGDFKRKFCTKNIFGYKVDTFEVDYQKNLLDSIVRVKEIVEFEGPNGRCHYQRFYPNGKIKIEAFFEDSDHLVNMEEGNSGSATVPFTGLWKYWYPNGNLKWEKKHDKVIGIEHLSMEKTYYENGQIASEEYSAVDGEPGYYSHYTFKTYREWHQNGQIKEEVEYDPDGEKDGYFKNWDKNGVLIKFENYKEDELHGVQKYYDENGNLTKSEKYRKGKLIKSKK